MHYSAILTVPAGTSLLTPVSTTLALPAGILKHLDVNFPRGCARMTSIVIFDAAVQLYPKTAGAAYCEDGYVVKIDTFQIFDSSKTLTIKGWAPLTSYQHVVTITAEVDTVEETAMKGTGYY
jgi:hypothetical protein